MKILVACEESQIVCEAFRSKGHEAYSCDILPTSGNHPEWHIQGDVIPLLNKEWDMIIAFPPCTYLSNAGACRLYPHKGQLDIDRYNKGLRAKDFFMEFYNANCERIAIENPISSKIFNMPLHTQEIQPYQFDILGVHPYTKKTRLWLKGLPVLLPTTPYNKPIANYVPAGTSRKIKTKYGAAKRGNDSVNRSKTFIGIAMAMSEQWG